MIGIAKINLSQTNFSSRFYPALMGGICCQQLDLLEIDINIDIKCQSWQVAFHIRGCLAYCSLQSFNCLLIPSCKPSFSVSFKLNVLYYTITTSSVKKSLVLLSKEFALCINPPHLWVSLFILNIICCYGDFFLFLMLLGAIITFWK